MNQLEKVKDYIKNQALLKTGDTVVMAVSGGPDSLALMHMFKTIAEEYKLKLVVAHLNHCLRPEADREEGEVKRIASSWSIPYETRAVDIRRLKRRRGISEEVAGRVARYRLLFDTARKYGASKIALGHHLDDQAETVLLNLLRGTGVDGLAGILPRYKRGNLVLIRPLLCLRRLEIEAYCRENSLQPFTDSSNLETDYTRNRLRLELIPRLEKEYNPRIREALFGLASLAAADRLFLQDLAVKQYRELAGFGSRKTVFRRRDLVALPAALSGRILRLAHHRHAPLKQMGRNQTERLMALVKSAKSTGQLNLPGGIRANLSYERLVLSAGEPPGQKKRAPIELKVPGTTVLPGGSLIEAELAKKEELVWPPAKHRAYLDYEQLPAGSLTVRFRWPGARFYPQGASGGKKLKDFLIDQKVPRDRRDRIPLVTVQGEILWAAGIRIAHPYRVTERTKQVLVLAYKKPGLSRPMDAQTR